MTERECSISINTFYLLSWKHNLFFFDDNKVDKQNATYQKQSLKKWEV